MISAQAKDLEYIALKFEINEPFAFRNYSPLRPAIVNERTGRRIIISFEEEGAFFHSNIFDSHCSQLSP